MKLKKLLIISLVSVVIVIAFIKALTLNTLIFDIQNRQISGNAMSPSYSSGQMLLVEKISESSTLQRGEVVEYQPPNTPDYVAYISRVVGLPGETVLINDGVVSINGSPLDETAYLPVETRTPSGSFFREGEEIIVPTGQYLLLSDNRANSVDSREIGLISRSAIRARYLLCYWNCK